MAPDGDSEDGPKPLSLDDSNRMGTTVDPEFDSSPDVHADGTLQSETDTQLTAEVNQNRIVDFTYALWHHIRAFLLAPFKLLRMYVIPILAFATLIATLYLLVSFA